MPKSSKRSPAQRAAWAKLSPWMKHKIKKSPQSVFARRTRREYGYCCAWCAKKRTLEAHHIYFRHTHPKLVEDLDNAVLLCTKCHDKIHALYTEDEIKYWDLISQLVIKRKAIKLPKKKRNPSLTNYVYDGSIKPEALDT